MIIAVMKQAAAWGCIVLGWHTLQVLFYFIFILRLISATILFILWPLIDSNRNMLCNNVNETVFRSRTSVNITMPKNISLIMTTLWEIWSVSDRAEGAKFFVSWSGNGADFSPGSNWWMQGLFVETIAGEWNWHVSLWILNGNFINQKESGQK
jgi:hypothetical protein